MRIAAFAALTVLGLMAMGIAGSYLGVFSGWATEPARVISVDNVRDQWGFAYDYIESLEAIAKQACRAADIVATTEATGGPLEARASQLLAYENNYDRVASRYNSALRDPFRAELVRPSNVPARAPTLAQMQESVCD